MRPVRICNDDGLRRCRQFRGSDGARPAYGRTVSVRNGRFREVTIDRVEIVSKNEGAVNVTGDWEEPRTFNLDPRDGVTALLGYVELTEGTYEQIRLVLAGYASVVMKEDAGGEVYSLKVPSGTQTGIKIPLNNLAVESGSYVTLTLDFDIAESFIARGNADTPAEVEGFNFTPVVKLLDVELDAAEVDVSEEEASS